MLSLHSPNTWGAREALVQECKARTPLCCLEWGVDSSKKEPQLTQNANGTRPEAQHQLRLQAPEVTTAVHHSWSQAIGSRMWKSVTQHCIFPYAEGNWCNSQKLPYPPTLMRQSAQHSSTCLWELTQVCTRNRVQEQHKQKSSFLADPHRFITPFISQIYLLSFYHELLHRHFYFPQSWV